MFNQEEKLLLDQYEILIGDIELSKEKLEDVASELAGSYYYHTASEMEKKFWRNILKNCKVLLYYYGESGRGLGSHLTLILEKDGQKYLFDGDHCSCGGFSVKSLDDFEKPHPAYDFSKLFDGARGIHDDMPKLQELVRRFYLSLNN